MAISRAESMKPLVVAHFYHAFSVNPDCEDGSNFRAAALEAFDLPDAAIMEDKQVIMPWANQILPAAMLAHNIPAEEEDTASVISVASSGAAARTQMHHKPVRMMLKRKLEQLRRCPRMKTNLNPRARRSSNK